MSPQSERAAPAPKRLEVGQPAPPFALPDQHGKVHRLADYRGRWVLLYFYPKDDTPGCTTEACNFRDDSEEYARRNAVILGISPDDAASHGRFAAKFNLPFPLLADTDKSACSAYGVWQEKSMYGRKYMGVARTTYLIDPEGKVAQRWDKVKVAKHSAEVMGWFDNRVA